MFSKKESEFLSGKLKVAKPYECVLRHRIREKLKNFYSEELPLLEKGGITEFYKGITENHNGVERARRDSNPRPNAPQAFALSMLCNEPKF